jgi:hypothetical protein
MNPDFRDLLAKRVFAALADFGAPLQNLTVDDLARPGRDQDLLDVKWLERTAQKKS